MTGVPVQTTPTFSAGTATTLFEKRCFSGAAARTYDVSPDGQRFLMIKSAAAEQAPPMVVASTGWRVEGEAARAIGCLHCVRYRWVGAT
jgi:hypothetical protein